MSGDVTQIYECDCGGDFSADYIHPGGGTPSLIIARNLLYNRQYHVRFAI